MLRPQSVTAPSPFVIVQATHTIRFERDLKAMPPLVFESWTQPKHVACWWDAMGEKLATCEIDLRVGGEFRFVTAHHPDKPFAGVYREIAAPHLLVFEANGAIGKIALMEHANGTRMAVEIVCRSAEHLAQFIQYGIADGTSRTLDNLAAYCNTGGT